MTRISPSLTLSFFLLSLFIPFSLPHDETAVEVSLIVTGECKEKRGAGNFCREKESEEAPQAPTQIFLEVAFPLLNPTPSVDVRERERKRGRQTEPSNPTVEIFFL
ncbi:hypothetical protein AAC387_Pa06g0395 [Persea americana]